VAFSGDGKLLAWSRDDSIQVWSTEAWAEVSTLRGHSRHVDSVAFSPNGKHLASAAQDNTIKVWSTETGTELCVP